MAAKQLSARAQLKDREWVEFDLTLNDDLISKIKFRAQGCEDLIQAAKKASDNWSFKKLSELKWTGISHWDLLVAEALQRLKGKFELPYKEDELCHCRKIPTAIVDEAIVLGAQSPEKVTQWTRASSGCGTCRPEVQKLIDYRLRSAK